jgi:hypothetical protein
MWLTIWQLSARRVLTLYAPVLLLLCGYTLLVTCPLGIDPPAMILGAIQGWALAFRLFVDPPRTAPFVFSRPFSRTRLFFYRWLIGLLLQGLTLLLMFAIIATGLRQATQVYCFRSNWYPMVRDLEVAVLWPVGLASLLVYQATCFVLSRRQLRGSRTMSKLRLAGNSAFAALVGIVAVFFSIGYVTARIQGAPLDFGDFLRVAITWPALAYVALLVIVSTLASLYCVRNIEVNA